MELKCSMYVSMKGKQSLGTEKKKRKSITVKIQMPFIAVNRVDRVQLWLNPAVGSHIDGGAQRHCSEAVTVKNGQRSRMIKVKSVLMCKHVH